MMVLALLIAARAQPQHSTPDVPRYLAMIQGGQAEQVKSELPSLLTKYPNNPGVLYVQGMLTRDGTEAVRVYQSIVDNFPKSEWADAALFKVYQFYYAIGLYRTAEMKMNQLKEDYPQSKYLSRGASDVETKSLAEENSQPEPAVQTPLDAGDSRDTPESAEPKPAHHATNAPVTSKPSEERGEFALQVGAYTTTANAEKQKHFFEGLRFPVEVITKVKNSKSLYLVLIGSYQTYGEAKAKKAEVKSQYKIDSIVVTR
jgi:cell division septation protein DedD